jgi:hypothetical protein
MDGVFDSQLQTHVVTQPTIQGLRTQPRVVREDVSQVVEDDLREFVASEREFFSVWRQQRRLDHHCARVRAEFPRQLLQSGEMTCTATIGQRVAFDLPLGIVRAVRACALRGRVPVGRPAASAGVRGIGRPAPWGPPPAASEAEILAGLSRAALVPCVAGRAEAVVGVAHANCPLPSGIPCSLQQILP